MAFSRHSLRSRYGDLERLIEARDEHRGYGDVTWKHVPNAGHEALPPDHRVGYVDRESLLKHAAGKFDQRAVDHEAGHHLHAMKRGDVMDIPHLQFSAGGRPDLTLKHVAALHAAGQLGAEKVPIAYHKKDAANMMFAVPGVEHPGNPSRRLDPRFKYRWNGQGYYAKPSFNNGKCPPGEAVGPNDTCVGGQGVSAPQERQSSDDQRPKKVNWRGELAAAVARRGAPGGGLPHARRAPPVPPPHVASQMRKALGLPKAPDPDAGGIPAAAKQAPQINEPSMKAQLGGKQGDIRELIDKAGDDREASHESMLKVAREAAARLHAEGVDVRPKKHPAGRQLSPQDWENAAPLGQGLSGVVWEGANLADGTPTVWKVDKGDNEKRMADAIISHRDLKLSSVPRYLETKDGYGLTDEHTGMPVRLIRREDIRDFKSGSRDEQALHQFFGELGAGGGFFGFGPSLGRVAHYVLNNQHNRQQAAQELETVLAHFSTKAKRYGPAVEQQFERVSGDLRQLARKGIFPCDLHSGNWGVRPSTGEVVMRDVGCYGVTD